MSPNPEVAPRLPVELEREILERAAWAHPSVPSLLLVVRRMKIWTELILYRTFIVIEARDKQWTYPRMSLAECLQLLDSRSTTLIFRDHVRHLFCDETSMDGLKKILTKCTGAQDLCLLDCKMDSALLPMLAEMAPRRLDSPLKPLFYPAAVDFAHPLSARLTHLCLDDRDVYLTDWASWAGLARLLCLTHLALTSADPRQVVFQSPLYRLGIT
ncbi:hypothetical protein C8R43DRAFT_1234018 [Mycena crocata]|nr:hypothetical protein C8R43DRAFT_1234018 [Mycena crocata]